MKKILFIFYTMFMSINIYAGVIGQYQTDKATFDSVKDHLKRLTEKMQQPAQQLSYFEHDGNIIFWADKSIENAIIMDGITIDGYKHFTYECGWVDNEKDALKAKMPLSVLKSNEDAVIAYEKFFNYENNLSSVPKVSAVSSDSNTGHATDGGFVNK